jgi:hypothetical protein
VPQADAKKIRDKIEKLKKSLFLVFLKNWKEAMVSIVSVQAIIESSIKS